MDYYALTIEEMADKVKGPFVLDGAYCLVSSRVDPDESPTLVSSGLNYSEDERFPVGLIPPEGNTGVRFLFYQKHEPTILSYDVWGDIYWDSEAEQWLLYMGTPVRVLSGINHSDIGMTTSQYDKTMTVETLRSMLSTVRTWYDIPERDKSFDILFDKLTIAELDEITEQVRKYMGYLVLADYSFDVSVDSLPLRVGNNGQVLRVEVEKKDNAAVRRPLINISVLPNLYGSLTHVEIRFENDDDVYLGRFNYVPTGVESYSLDLRMGLSDTNYLIASILRVISESQHQYVK